MTAALIDSGHDDYMLETAMLKVFATDTLWRIINDTIQIFGGKAYFTDEPYERMMRDARINMIGEGANDVLRAFVALVGMRDVGLELQSVVAAFKRPLKHFGKTQRFRRPPRRVVVPPAGCAASHMRNWSRTPSDLGKLVAQFRRECRTAAARSIARGSSIANINSAESANRRLSCTSAPACSGSSMPRLGNENIARQLRTTASQTPVKTPSLAVIIFAAPNGEFAVISPRSGTTTII